MKAPSFLLILITLLSCYQGKPETTTTIEETPVATTKDTVIKAQPEEPAVMEEQEVVTYPIPPENDLIIYSYFTIEIDKHQAGFIPLSDDYRWSESPDSLAIEDEYLGMTKYENDNYHILSPKYRSRFLSRKNINPGDSIFIYHVATDSLARYAVKDIPIVAFINPYGTQYEVEQYDYQIGFEVKDLLFKGGYYSSTLAYVGSENLFNTGSLAPMNWEVITDSFPAHNLAGYDSIRIANSEPQEKYVFTHDGFEYFLQNRNYPGQAGPDGRLLVIRSAKTKNLIKSATYFDTEGSYLKPLSSVENDYGNGPMQWTGKLFKHKPPVIFGFLGMSFGCPGIQFIDENEADIWIRCDNRH